jgi:hypothetical protein
MSSAGTMVIAPWTLRVWDAAAGQEIARISNQRGLVGAISPSGDVLATAEPGGEAERAVRIRIWKLPSAHVLPRCLQHGRAQRRIS